jgi:hypothetical protein
MPEVVTKMGSDEPTIGDAMPEIADRLDLPETPEPVTGLDVCAAGWSVAYPGDASPTSDEDAEAIALRLWGEGRKDEALAFLESRIGRDKAATGDDVPDSEAVASGSGASRALAIILSSQAVQAAASTDAAPTGHSVPEPSGRVINIAPEPRVGDMGRLRLIAGAGGVMRPGLLLAIALVAGSMGAGIAFWPDEDVAPLQTSIPPAKLDAAPAEPAVDVAVAATVAPRVIEIHAVPRPSTAPAPPDPQPAVEEPAGAESAPAAAQADFGPPAPVEAAQQPIVAAPAEPMPAALTPAEEPVQVARVPKARPPYVAPRTLPEMQEQREQVAVVEAPPPEMDYEYLAEADRGYRPEEYDYLPPELSERRAAAARYAAERRAAAEFQENGQPPVVLWEEPAFIVEGPVIPRAVRGFLP